MAKSSKLDILLIMADDIGWFNVSAYNRGVMGGPTPNIDRIANEGLLATDHYGQASCTAGRAAFVTGQIPMRTGLTTVGMPGAKQGLQHRKGLRRRSMSSGGHSSMRVSGQDHSAGGRHPQSADGTTS